MLGPLLIIFLLPLTTTTDVEFGTEILDEFIDVAKDVELEFTQGLPELRVTNIGKSYTMTCSIKGPAPMNLYIVHDRIATYKKRKRMLAVETIYDPEKPNELSVVYSISSVKQKHDGIYRCIAESIDGQAAVSVGDLRVLDPCQNVECGFREQCVNMRGSGVCTCNYECPDPAEDDAICVDGTTFSSMCHVMRTECRSGAPLEGEKEAGTCPDTMINLGITEASCSLMGEGHVTKFNGDFFTFKGKCPYKMIEDTRGGQFVVYARYQACGSNDAGNCLRSVTMYVDRVYGFSLERGWLINDNGKSRNVGNGETINLGGSAITLSRVGKTLVGTVVNKGITFYYDGLNYFKVKVPFDYVESVDDFRGFCGQIPTDYMPSTGRDVSAFDVDMPALSSSSVCEPQFGSSDNSPSCDDNSEDIRAALSSTAGACPVSMDLFVARATEDVCGCALGNDINYCYCNVAYAYKEECRQAGVQISVSEELCEKSFHQDAFREEGLSYRRRNWFKSY